jgi:tRNA (guanosine-2'-O-)-methyltransferase
MTSERQEKIKSVLARRQPDLTIILENVFDPHNISAIMRTCDAVGIQELYVLNTKLPRHEKWGFKSSRSAMKWVTAHVYVSVTECIASVRKNYKTVLTTRLHHEGKSLYEVDLTDSIALVFGNEQNGISDELNELADGSIIIPQAGMLHSLNISVACAVVLYEALRQKSNAGHYEKVKLQDNIYEKLSIEWGLSK